MKLGIFDSGAGGLSVLDSLLKMQLFQEVVYYGDTARLPYGTKHPTSIIDFSLQALDFFIQQKVDIIVVACNTASAYALDAMQKKCPFIPIIGVIKSGILAITNKLKNLDSKILILATKATINSRIYQKGLQELGYTNLTSIATSLLVPLVEENIFQGPIVNEVLKYYFKNLDFIPDAIVLGCTHFPLLSQAISSFFDHKSLLVHSGEAIAQYLYTILPHVSKSSNTTLEFFASSDVVGLKNTAQKWLDLSSYKNLTIL